MPKKNISSKKVANKKEAYQKPRGMRDLIGDDFYTYLGFYEKASDISIYYGFNPIDIPTVEEKEVFERSMGESSDAVEKEMYDLKPKGGAKLALRPEFTAGVVRSYIENGMQSLPQPVMLYSFGKVYRHDRPQRGRYRDPRQFNLEIMGSEKSVNDAMIMHVAYIILKEVGLDSVTFAVNSMGDKESRNHYLRELTNYYKKNLSTLNKNCADCAKRFKVNPLRLLDCKNDTCVELAGGAPETVSFLNESSKKHFKELLEYLEALSIPYTIDGHLVRGLDYYMHTVFEIFYNPPASEVKTDGEDSEANEEIKKPLAIGAGGRYDGLAKQLGSKKDVPSVGVALGVDRIVEIAEYNRPIPRVIKKPKIFFIQLGYEAKLKSLSVIELMREAKTPVKLSPSKDSLSSQLGTAERLGIPYAIIMGQKEVMEGSVIIRNMKNRSQKTIMLDKLPAELKKLK